MEEVINVSKILTVLGFLLILLAVIFKLANAPLFIVGSGIRLLSLLVFANTSFILAILLKK